MSTLWARIREDWERQPLAILGQGISIMFAVGLGVYGNSHSSPGASLGQPIATATTALAICILTASAFASACQYVFKKSIIAGFFVSLLLASISILLFSLLAMPSLIRTTINENGTYKGALIDVSYWSVFAVFVAICSASAIKRVFDTWGNMRSPTDDGTDLGRGVAPIELILFAAAWGACFGASQQNLLAGFVFERPPAQQARAT